uniref:Uncharacterized protein n=1 Tax=Arundo donax TaxID=35708 RepID=A0A0A9FDL5_ARUDO
MKESSTVSMHENKKRTSLLSECQIHLCKIGYYPCGTRPV